MKQLPVDGLLGICIAMDCPTSQADHRSGRHVGGKSVASSRATSCYFTVLIFLCIHSTTTGTLET